MVLGFADIIFIGGAVAQAVCHTVWSMVSASCHCLGVRHSANDCRSGEGSSSASVSELQHALRLFTFKSCRLRSREVVWSFSSQLSSFHAECQSPYECAWFSVVMITLGQVIAYGIGAGFFHVRGGWRWMVGLGAVPAGVQLVFLFFLPESRTFILPSILKYS